MEKEKRENSGKKTGERIEKEKRGKNKSGRREREKIDSAPQFRERVRLRIRK